MLAPLQMQPDAAGSCVPGNCGESLAFDTRATSSVCSAGIDNVPPTVGIIKVAL